MLQPKYDKRLLISICALPTLSILGGVWYASRHGHGIDILNWGLLLSVLAALFLILGSKARGKRPQVKTVVASSLVLLPLAATVYVLNQYWALYVVIAIATVVLIGIRLARRLRFKENLRMAATRGSGSAT